MAFPRFIAIEEQGLRDGLQNFPRIFPTETKIRWIEKLVGAGLRRLQVASFVHQERVPAMADAEELFKQLSGRFPGVLFSALVLNAKGLERAIAASVGHLAISLSASNTHSFKNTGMEIPKARQEIGALISKARREGISVRAGIQCAFGCRYEGQVPEREVRQLAAFLLDQDIAELSLADSTGMAHPLQVESLVGKIVALAGNRLVGLHLHDTESKGYANLYAGLRVGVGLFDTALGGLGGCPFIAGASGNVATEDVVHLLRQMGFDPGIDIRKVAEVSAEIGKEAAGQLPGRLHGLIGREDIKII